MGVIMAFKTQIKSGRNKVHFKKKWHLLVRTWFKQKTRKIRRRKARSDRTKATYVDPYILKFRPIMWGQTNKYRARKILGRGFTLEEMNFVGIKVNLVPSIGLVIDKRRKNRSQDFINENVSHIKDHMSKLDFISFKCTEHTENCSTNIQNINHEEKNNMKIKIASYCVDQKKLEKLRKSNPYSSLRLERMKSRMEGEKIRIN